MATEIHPTAVVDPGAELGEDTIIGPYCVISGSVRIGTGCRLHSHVVIDGGETEIGDKNEFFPFASIGQRTQDLKYDGEPTGLKIGDANTFREFCTVNRSTAKGGATVVGSHGTFLTYSHIGHDSIVGDNVIFSNNATLGGHVEVGDYAIVSGLAAVHQFCRIGAHSILGGCTKIVQDVVPFMMVDGNPARTRAVNTVGLSRRGFSEDAIKQIKQAHRILFRKKLTREEALVMLGELEDEGGEIAMIREFVEQSERGIV